MVHNQLINKIIATGYFILILAGCSSRHNNHMEEYVRKADPAFRYEIEETYKADGWTEYRVKMVSGTWLTEKEVNHTEWWHWVTIVVPDDVAETEALVVIGGGSTRDKEPQAANELLVQAAVETKSIIANIIEWLERNVTDLGDNGLGFYRCLDQ